MRRTQGFTLLELLVAVAVFAVVATMAYGGLRVVVDAKSRLDEQAREWRALQIAVYAIERDLRQAVPRAIREDYGDPRPALQGGEDRAEWSRLDLSVDGSGVGASLGRVRYYLADGELWQERELVLDRAPRESARRRRLLEGVESLEFRYWAAADAIGRDWPPARGDLPLDSLPRGVEFRLRGERFGEVSRLVELPEPPP